MDKPLHRFSTPKLIRMALASDDITVQVFGADARKLYDAGFKAMAYRKVLAALTIREQA